MSAILKPIGKAAGGLLGGLAGLLGGKAPAAPQFRAPPQIASNAMAGEAAEMERRRRLNASGRNQTLLSQQGSVDTPSLNIKSLLGG